MVFPDRVEHGSAVGLRDGRIVAIGPVDAVSGDRTLVFPDLDLWPGLVDIHVHGAMGRYFHRDDDLHALLATLRAWGVTGVLPTVITRPPTETLAAVRRLAHLQGMSQFLGIHLEGPFLNPKRQGAQESARPPDPAELRTLLDAGPIRMVTLAPEMPGADMLIDMLQGVRISAGHTEATDLSRVHQTTHTANAMAGLHHRTLGTLGVALSDDALDCEVIADGVHVHPDVLKIMWRAKGTDRIILVSDAMAMAGLPDGTYDLDGRPVEVRAGRAHLHDGTIAGSVAPLYVGVRTMVREVGVPLHEAVRMASLNPARALGLDQEIGSLAVGKAADLVLVDGDLVPRRVWVRGS